MHLSIGAGSGPEMKSLILEKPIQLKRPDIISNGHIQISDLRKFLSSANFQRTEARKCYLICVMKRLSKFWIRGYEAPE